MAYAWSTIDLGGGKVIKVGEKVTSKEVGSKEEYDFLMSEGVIRDAKYPEFARNGESPKNAILRKARQTLKEAEAGIYSDFSDLDSKPSEDTPSSGGSSTASGG